MHGEAGNQNRRGRDGRALLLGALIFLGACASGGSEAGVPPLPEPIATELLREWSGMVRRYIDALHLCASPSSRDWEQASRELKAIHPFHMYKEELGLIADFRTGSEAARKELGRRGAMYQALSAFWRPYDKTKPEEARKTLEGWDEARKKLLAAGEGGPPLLAIALLSILLNTQMAEAWEHARYQLVESGPVAFETAVAVARELATRTSTKPLFRHEDLTQVLLALIGFGRQGRPVIQELAAHVNSNVRRTVARALGEAVDDAQAPLMVKLLSDPEWAVRASAAEGMGRMGPMRAKVGPALAERIRVETVGFVLVRALRAMGEVHYEEGVPDLMKSVEARSMETAEAAMYALYRITGEKLNTRGEWRKWYAERYPAWKSRPRK